VVASGDQHNDDGQYEAANDSAANALQGIHRYFLRAFFGWQYYRDSSFEK
jgi:hypothetical protein